MSRIVLPMLVLGLLVTLVLCGCSPNPQPERTIPRDREFERFEEERVQEERAEEFRRKNWEDLEKKRPQIEAFHKWQAEMQRSAAEKAMEQKRLDLEKRELELQEKEKKMQDRERELQKREGEQRKTSS